MGCRRRQDSRLGRRGCPPTTKNVAFAGYRRGIGRGDVQVGLVTAPSPSESNALSVREPLPKTVKLIQPKAPLLLSLDEGQMTG